MRPHLEEEWPEPIRPDEIEYKLRREAELGPRTSDEECLRRFKALPEGRAWLDDHYGEKPEDQKFFTWERWHDVPYEILAKMFSFDELLRMWIQSFVMSDLGEWFEKTHPLLWKIQNCQWQYGAGRSYDALIAAVEGLQRIEVGIPDFSACVIHTRATNTHAWAEHIREVYLDAAFGLAIFYRGQHVLTIGFAFAGEGIIIPQVQLRSKKGNRFLFKLPMHYVDLALDIFRRAFPREPLFLVTGESAVAAVNRAYMGKKLLSDEESSRMLATYNRPLAAYRRGRTLPYDKEWRRYVRLHPKKARRAVQAGVSTKDVP